MTFIFLSTNQRIIFTTLSNRFLMITFCIGERNKIDLTDAEPNQSHPLSFENQKFSSHA